MLTARSSVARPSLVSGLRFLATSRTAGAGARPRSRANSGDPPAARPRCLTARRRHRRDLKRSAGAFSNLTPDTFRVFEVSLADVAETFKRQPTPWNRNYKTAQGFFENSPSGRETRRLFSLEGRALFAGGAERQRDLSDDVDFLLGFDFGTREMMQQVWSYIVYKNSLRFCEAGNLVAHCAMAEAS